MSDNKTTLQTFFSALRKRDFETMVECYHSEVVYTDPVFPELVGRRACAMWKLVCRKGIGLRISYSEIEASEIEGSARWEAAYTYLPTNRRVEKKVMARFEFADGKITRHTDTFDFDAWIKMAFGWKAVLFGRGASLKERERARALRELEQIAGGYNLAPSRQFEMYPRRPEPELEIDEYDDSDPYACMAAPAVETKWDRYVGTVEACGDSGELDLLYGESAANVMTALFDLWLENRREGNRALAAWAAREAERLGDDRLVGYDERN